MGYQTDFVGQFDFSRPLTVAEMKTLTDFADERHEGDGPGYYCQWVPNETGTALEWDGNEKFYDYVEWAKDLIERFFKPWGVVLNGKVRWNGEESGDHGVIRITDNVVESAMDVSSNPLE